MPIFSSLEKFFNREDGAVTVDWVILTAGVVGFGSIVILYLAEPVQSLDEKSGQALADMEVERVLADDTPDN